MDTRSALLAIFEGNHRHKGPVMQIYDDLFAVSQTNDHNAHFAHYNELVT